MTGPLLGIDAGTTSIKAAAFTPDGEQLVCRTQSTPVVRPNHGWVEQDMEATWKRTAAAITEVTDALDREVTAVGVTGQGGGCWLVDANGNPVRNAILWSDSRAADYVQEVRREDMYNEIFDSCGYGLFSGMALPLLRWLRKNKPDSVEQTATVFACKDWLKFRLTGERATDPSDASLMHYLPDTGTFSQAVSDCFEVGGLADCVPEPVDGSEIVGRVTEQAAVATGLPVGVPVVSGVMDVAASAFGSGAAAPSTYSTVLGTTLQCQRILDEPTFAPPRTGYTLDLGVEGLGLRAMGAMAGTPNLDWLAKTLDTNIEQLEILASDTSLAADGVVYHPYLSTSGEKAPFVAPGARAQFTGLAPEHDRGHLARAVYEGVALAARDCCEALPGDVNSLYMSGGGARSELWCQLFADCLDATVAVPAGEEFGAKGAALLAGVGVGTYSDLWDAIAHTTAVNRSYEPRPKQVASYDQWFSLYKMIRETMGDVWNRQ